MHHFGVAQHQAKEKYNKRHSREQPGTGEEEIPAWACKFFQFFEAMESNPSPTAQAAEMATQRRNVVTSVMGRQAPLRPHLGSVLVQLWTETRGSKRARGSMQSRQQQIINVKTERFDTDAMHEQLVEE